MKTRHFIIAVVLIYLISVCIPIFLWIYNHRYIIQPEKVVGMTAAEILTDILCILAFMRFYRVAPVFSMGNRHMYSQFLFRTMSQSNTKLAYTTNTPVRINLSPWLRQGDTPRGAAVRGDRVEMISKGDVYYICMTPDADWLNDESRVYPITIDPQVTTSSDAQNIIDNYVMENSGVQTYTLDRLYIGKKNGNRTRSYIKFSAMPTIPSGSVITSAQMTLWLTTGQSTGSTASAYMVTGGDWASKTISWANMPAANTQLQSNISHNSLTKYTFSCLTAVKHWYTSMPNGKYQNYGIMVRYYNEGVNDYNPVYSADYATTSKRPSLTINYQASAEEISIREGATYTISVSSSSAVTWQSSNSSVATVSSSGVVRGIKPGEATITATSNGTILNRCLVHVRFLDGVYAIKSFYTGLNLATYGATAENTPAKLITPSSSGLSQVRQLWRIAYLGNGYYSIRPVNILSMTLHAVGSVGSPIDIVSASIEDSQTTLTYNNRWGIASSSDGKAYYIHHQNNPNMGLKPVDGVISSGMNVTTANNNGSSNTFKWIIVKTPMTIVNLETIYDQAYVTRYSNASSRISNQLAQLQQKYYLEFGIWINYLPPTAFVSYADANCTANPDQLCTHTNNQGCQNSNIDPSGVASLHDLHHTNIFNILYRVPFPNPNESFKMVCIGRKTCISGSNTHSTPFFGVTYPTFGLIGIVNTESELSQQKTIVHEFGHLYNAPDHYGGTEYSTEQINAIYGVSSFNRHCIYGEDKDLTSVQASLAICDGCRTIIEGNTDLYDHR